ncbi:MAG: hypothetical protein J0H69_23980 [Burkholderiales bacterium]|nr:hypothetical protein [Burkholderiales bacterium]
MSASPAVIVEIVSFANPPGASREQLLEGARATLPRWQANRDLVRKHYAASLDGSRGMGIYLWPSVEAAKAGHDAAWVAAAEARTGAPVSITYHDLLMVLDNETGTVTEPPASTR